MHRTLSRLVALAGLTAACAAGAAQHHICYQGEAVNGQPTAIWGCRDDASSLCSISAPGTTLANYLPGGAPGNFKQTLLPNAGLFTATMSYADGSIRRCQISALSPTGNVRAPASQGAVLTGFTTDASGMVTTGVWRLQSAAAARAGRVTVEVPIEFVAVGGGVLGQETPYGALVVESYQSDTLSGINGVGNQRRWTVRTSDLYYPDPHVTVAYAIGMRITRSHPNGTDMPASTLIGLLRTKAQDSLPAIASTAVNQAMLPFKTYGGFVPLSGGVQAQADASNSPFNLLGQYVTVSAPLHDACATPCTTSPPMRGWRVESKDHWLNPNHPGTVNTALLGLVGAVTVDGVRYRVVGAYAMATSGWAGHPAIDAGNLSGFALTGVGGAVDWRSPPRACLPGVICGSPGTLTLEPPGNLLWKLQPRPDFVGASVASKDHGYASAGQITGYALGVRLEP